MDKILQEHGGNFVQCGNKKMRCGYTTGTAAAAAAKAALTMLLTGCQVEMTELTTPAGICFRLAVENVTAGGICLEKKHARGKTCSFDGSWVSCGVRKDGGDDPDVTHGLLIKAKVFLKPEPGVEILGGIGVGKITRPGLEQPVGYPAINQIPRSMIEHELSQLLSQRWNGACAGPCGQWCGKQSSLPGVCVEIQVPEGGRIAEKTFNPRLGIEGGISILGTTGLVIPMSEPALKESIRLEIRQQLAEGKRILLVSPGNYGRAGFLSEFGIDPVQVVLCSNYIGDTVDMAAEEGAESILLAGHLGKLVKVAAGIMNTHSRQADGRMEILSAQALLAGADRELAVRILNCISTDEAWRYLKKSGLDQMVAHALTERIQEHLLRRAEGKIGIEVLLYSPLFGRLCATSRAEEMAACAISCSGMEG